MCSFKLKNTLTFLMIFWEKIIFPVFEEEKEIKKAPKTAYILELLFKYWFYVC